LSVFFNPFVDVQLLLFVVLFPQSKHNSSALIMACSWVWGAIASFLFPDRAGYTQYLELENYYLQHVLLLLIPVFYIVIRRADAYAHMSVYESWVMCIYYDCLQNLYHVFFLWALAVLSDINLNYMLSSPTALPLILRSSLHYRSIIMVMTTLLATPITGLIIPRLLMWLPSLPFVSYPIGSSDAGGRAKAQ
jgi:hypothetical protein